MRLPSWRLAAALLLAPMPGAAQAGGPSAPGSAGTAGLPPRQAAPPPLSWQDCVRIALRSNPSLDAARRDLEAAGYQRRGAANVYYPRLSLNHSYSDQTGGPGASRWGASAVASMDLYKPGSWAGYETASAAERRQEAALRLESAQLRLSLRLAFTGLLFAQEELKVSRRILDMRRANARLLELRYDSGRESKGNMLQSKAQVADAEAVLDQSDRELEAARLELASRLGVDDFSLLAVTGTWTLGSAPEDAPGPGAADGHPQLAQDQAELERSRAGLKGARAGLWPTLSASYARSLSGASEFPGNPRWSLGAALSLPILGSGPTASFYAVSAARAGLESAQRSLEASRRALGSQLASAWTAYRGALEQQKVQELLLEAGRQRAEESDVRYSSGLMSFENWEQVVGQLVNAERGVVQADLSAAKAEAQWQFALGRPLEE